MTITAVIPALPGPMPGTGDLSAASMRLDIRQAFDRARSADSIMVERQEAFLHEARAASAAGFTEADFVGADFMGAGWGAADFMEAGVSAEVAGVAKKSGPCNLELFPNGDIGRKNSK
jgi:hypothetical protein